MRRMDVYGAQNYGFESSLAMAPGGKCIYLNYKAGFFSITGPSVP